MPYKDPKKKKEYNTEYNRQWRDDNREKVRKIGMKAYYNNQGVQIGRMADYRERKRMEKATRPRSNDCEVCGKHCRTVFDHDHVTGKFRGWLCNGCNSALGHAKDNIQTLLKLAEYLQTSRGSPLNSVELIKSPIQLEKLK